MAERGGKRLMDAVKFLKEQERMCKSFKGTCINCPMFEYCGVSFENIANIEQQVKIVEKWSKEHPIKTRISELQKIFPNLKLESNSLPYICPLNVDYELKHCSGHCYECKTKYWLEEIE